MKIRVRVLIGGGEEHVAALFFRFSFVILECPTIVKN